MTPARPTPEEAARRALFDSGSAIEFPVRVRDYRNAVRAAATEEAQGRIEAADRLFAALQRVAGLESDVSPEHPGYQHSQDIVRFIRKALDRERALLYPNSPVTAALGLLADGEAQRVTR